MPISVAAPFSPVTVMVTASSPENVSATQANVTVPPGVVVAGDTVHEPDGGIDARRLRGGRKSETDAAAIVPATISVRMRLLHVVLSVGAR